MRKRKYKNIRITMTTNIFGININILEIPISIIILMIVVNDIWLLKTKILLKNKVSFWLQLVICMFYLSAILIYSISARNLNLVAKAFLKWVEIFSIAGLVFLFVRNRTRFKYAYWLIFFSTVMTLIKLIVEIITGNYQIVFERTLPAYDSLFAFVLIFPFALFQKKRSAVFFSWPLLFSVVASLSRGAWFALLIFFLYIWQYSNKRVVLKYLGLIAAVVLITTTIFKPIRTKSNYRIEEILTLKTVSNVERSVLIKYAFLGFSTSPLFGVGSLNFPLFLQQEG